MDHAQINRAIADVAAANHALVPLALIEPLGIGRDRLHDRVRNGQLEVVDQGLFRIAGAPPTWHQRLLGACWCHGAEALASHRSAALLWRLDGVVQAPLEVLVPRWQRHRKRPGIRVHETTTLRGIDRTVVDGIPCTSVVRTLLDLTAVIPERRADQAVEDALRRGLCTLEALADRFGQVARRGRPGVVVGRRLIEKRGIGYVPTMSEFERRVSELGEAAGLGRPERQIPVVVAGTTVYIDLGWRDLKLGIECDGLFDHASNVSLPWDDDRQNELVLQGWLILRFTWQALTERPDHVVAQIRAAIAASRARLDLDPRPHHPGFMR